MTAAPALTLSGVSKRYGIVEANRDVSVTVAAGSIHAVVGENGAGKSTLMKIAYGMVRPDTGSLAVRGDEVDVQRWSPRAAIARGVGMVHQHFMLVPPLTVVENVVLGREPTRAGALPVLDLERTATELAELAGRFGFEVDPRARIEELSVGEQQRVEILKVLWRGADVLILDEPTAVLTPGEVRDLFGVLRALVGEGKTVVLITHKLDEVTEIADRVTVMRRGVVTRELVRGELSAEAIARAMVGRAVVGAVERPPAEPGEVVLAVDRVTVGGRGDRPAVDGVSLEIRGGEILGIAGVEGNGQAELIDAIAGLRRVALGAITLGGVDVTAASPRARHDHGLSHVPADRRHRGLVLDFTVEENLVLGQQRDVATWRGLDAGAIRTRAARLIDDYEIRPPDPEAPARGLSGGNQQKVVVARELARTGARLLVAAQPTRGVDIGAIETIHRRLVEARGEGLAVLLVSAELSELHALADRIAVLHRGRIVATLEGEALADPDLFERLGALMTGASG